MSVGVAGVIVLSSALLLAVVVMIIRIMRDPARLQNLQYLLFIPRRRSFIPAVVMLVLIFALNGFLGIGFLAAGDVLGWAFLLFAALPLLALGLCIYVVRLPFHLSEDDTD